VQRACRGRAEGVQRACRGRAVGVQRACRGRAEGVQRACRGRADNRAPLVPPRSPQPRWRQRQVRRQRPPTWGDNETTVSAEAALTCVVQGPPAACECISQYFPRGRGCVGVWACGRVGVGAWGRGHATARWHGGTVARRHGGTADLLDSAARAHSSAASRVSSAALASAASLVTCRHTGWKMQPDVRYACNHMASTVAV